MRCARSFRVRASAGRKVSKVHREKRVCKVLRGREVNLAPKVFKVNAVYKAKWVLKAYRANEVPRANKVSQEFLVNAVSKVKSVPRVFRASVGHRGKWARKAFKVNADLKENRVSKVSRVQEATGDQTALVAGIQTRTVRRHSTKTVISTV